MGNLGEERERWIYLFIANELLLCTDDDISYVQLGLSYTNFELVAAVIHNILHSS